MARLNNYAKGRSLSYKFTVDNKFDEDLLALKRAINKNNRRISAFGGMRLRVVLAGRGPRKEAGLKDYDCVYAYQSYLPARHSTSFDVYVYDAGKVPRPYIPKYYEW